MLKRKIHISYFNKSLIRRTLNKWMLNVGVFLAFLLLSTTQLTAQTTDTYTTSGTDTWTAPACVATVTVEVWGAGGGSGGSTSGDGGSGGGGGAYSISVLTVSPGSTYNLNVGTGGGGGAGGDNYGSDGGDSWFSLSGITPVSTATGSLAKGGLGGEGDGQSGGRTGGQSASGYGDTKYSGGTGGIGGGSGGGGGGSSAGTAIIGNNGSNNAGSGGSAPAGGGAGANGNGSVDGYDATEVGGGGGGGDDDGNPGGDGFRGQVHITYGDNTLITTNNPASTAGNVCASSTLRSIYEFTLGSCNGTTLTDLSFTTAGTYDASDLSNFELWYNTSNDLGSATQLSSDLTTSLGTGAHSFATFSQALTSNVIYYFWITTDLAASPTNGVTISVSALGTGDVTVSSGTKLASTSAGGTHTVLTSNVAASAEAAGQNTIAVDAVLTLTGAAVGGSATTGAWSVLSSSPSGTHTLSSTAQTSTPETVTFTPEGSYTGTVTLRLTSDGCTEYDDRVVVIQATPSETTYTSPGADTWDAPCGVSSITVQVWGGGGGGGGNNTSSDGGGGGGGGGYSTMVIAVDGGTTYNFNVGIAGTAGPQANNPTGNGGDGGNSWFSTTGSEPTNAGEGTLAYGGDGGASPSGGSGGVKGLGGIAGFGDGTPYAGGDGGTGEEGSTGEGAGGGGSAGSSGAGGNGATSGTAGTAGSGGGASGGTGGGYASDGNPGSDPGGGGGSAGETSAGAAGGVGKVIITPGAVAYPSITSTENDIHACYLAGATDIDAGPSTATNYDDITWTTLDGSGTIGNSTSLSTATYTPSANDVTVGSVSIRITAKWTSGCDTDGKSKDFYVYSDTSWIGATDTDWHTAGNWCNGVPSCSDNVLIPSVPANQPVISSTASADNITINSGATLTTATTNLLNICGNWTNNGTYTYNTGAVHFTGAADQTIGGSGALTFYDLVANNTGASGSDNITLSQPTTITNDLTLTDGIINTDATNLLDLTNTATDAATGGSNDGSSFVDGPLKWSITTGGTYIFPTGDGSTSWARVALSSLSAAGVFTCEYTAASHTNVDASDVDDDTDSPYLENVSVKEYWDVDRVSGGNAAVTLYWADSDFSNIDDCTSDNDLVVAHYTASEWRNANTSGTSTATGTCSSSAGTITSDLMTSFSPFSFGSKSGGLNPLPIELISFTANYNGSSVDIEWVTASEINNDYFTIERSINGINFEIVEDFIPSKGVSGYSTSTLSYATEDLNNASGVYYYRLKQTDFDGKFEYSNVQVVTIKGMTDFVFTLAPNPSSGANVSLLLTANEFDEINVDIYDILGQSVYRNAFEVESEESNIYLLNFIRPLSPGVYVVTVTIDSFTSSKRMVVE